MGKHSFKETWWNPPEETRYFDSYGNLYNGETGQLIGSVCRRLELGEISGD